VSVRNSVTHPYRIDWLNDEGEWTPGRLGLGMAPGRRGGSITGRWERDLEADLRRIKEQYQVHTVASLLGPSEYKAMGIPGYGMRVRGHEMELLEFPIEDGGGPTNMGAFDSFVEQILEPLETGRRVLIHCLAGIGRTGVVASCVALRGGWLDGEQVVDVVKQRRRNAVETAAQAEFVQQYAQHVQDG